MKKFQFRLDTLLKYRRMQKEQAQLTFARASQVLREEEIKLEQFTQLLGESISHFNDSQDQPWTVEKLKSFHNYFEKIRGNIKDQSGRVHEAQIVQQKYLQELQQAVKNFEVVNKLKAKRLLQYKEDVLSADQKILDELGLQNYVRKD
ncbi:hypothetical protein SDC9_08893 [bioreactor metagenome]|uniref:Flagellar FliJ protein n=1 Tax=bioreactor metagenome TaxID=1076179 RepID=A0A644TBM3_9ZZZZ